MIDPPSLYHAARELWADPDLLSATSVRESDKQIQRKTSGWDNR
jgi:hypothetical protein